MNEYHKQILTDAQAYRSKEVTEYQVNIDNYRLAIEKIGDDEELQAFKQHLQELLESGLLEQRKAKLMLDVITEQLEG